jgi:two-component system, response regulator PdtaR
MSHALIIDDNMIVSRAIENRLVELGFDSFDRTWTEGQAMAAAARRSPDLVVIGDTIESGCALNAARSIAMERDTPVLMVTADPGRARRRLPDDVSFGGPFLINEIENAVALARASD